ncbi:hypothetical protein [Brucella anthropi]|uniref:hypothetical protein n=1 Tax=Brucella anthropi TaxID=529 RepID=UPI00124C7E3A|nr:hypothetical protein [Brucella anthropi]KAB2726471.1 hypothetical protein F9K76_07130 [Brucella anthropi]KAB2743633.1 hypothetical protein F9K74_07075 [Brucella anthropi]KAB2804380.1 hypothetical protein F9K83_07075 [Brucella anthropi]
MTNEDWARFKRWHELFDRLCQLRGYSANADLANDICRQMGRSGERDFHAIEKNLRDWRLGRRLPLRRNALILSRFLQVDSDPALRAWWDATYRALDASNEYDSNLSATYEDAAIHGNKAFSSGKGRRRFLIGLATALPVGLVAAVIMNGRENSYSASVDKTKLPTIAYNARTFLSPGAEKLIHGVVEGCDGSPSKWGDVEPGLPVSRTGSFVDGGLATQMMNGCGKEMVVRAVKFVAARPGVEELNIFDAYFKIEVAPSSVHSD